MAEPCADIQHAQRAVRQRFGQVSLRRDYYGPGQDAMVMLRPIAEGDDWAVECA